MFKDGKMVAGNAVITEPGVTHFSVNGAQHVSPYKFKEFYRERLAGKTLEVKSSGYKTFFSDSGEGEKKAAKGVRSQTRAETGKKMESVVEESHHLHHGEPTHKEGEDEHRRKMVDNAGAFHVFGCPISINRDRTLMWIDATHRRGESDPMNLTFYEFGVSESIKNAGDASLVHGPNPHRTEASPAGDTLADVLRGVKSNFEGKSEIVENV